MGESVKKKLEIIFVIIFSLAIVLTIIDLITINVTHKPMIILNNEGETYYGLLYNTYNCTEENKVYIKFKTTKFSCPVTIKGDYTIVDKSKEIKNFACNEALEEIYRNEDYSYNLTCEKGSYVVVKYENGTEETIKEALDNKNIEIKDLDIYNIEYVKVPLKTTIIDTDNNTIETPTTPDTGSQTPTVPTTPGGSTGGSTVPTTPGGSTGGSTSSSTGSQVPTTPTIPSTSNDTQIINPGINKNIPITKPGISTNKSIVVVDKSAGQYCLQAIEYFYKNYYFTCIKSQSVYVIIDGQEYLLKYALNNGIVTMDELEAAGYKFNKNEDYADR